MRIICIDGRDINGAGGALRGQEMARALRSLGHDCVLKPPDFSSADPLARLGKMDAVIYTGTWHQLMGGRSDLIRLTEQCEAAGIPAIWWYGSNGSVFGCVDADPAKRADAERRVISMIAERRFIGVICPYSVDIYKRHGLPLDKMRLIPSVFDGNLFTPPQNPRDRHIAARLREDFDIPANAFVIGTIGNCPNSKGGDETIEAVALLAKEMPDLHYLILHTPEGNLNKIKATSPDGQRVGNSEWDVLQLSKKLARDRGVADRVHFVGMRVKREAMPHLYWCMDAYCSPSKAENLGQPLIESQLCGLPLVTYQGFSFDFCACPHSAQQIPAHHTETDDYGLVIPFADPAVLAAAIGRARNIAESGRPNRSYTSYDSPNNVTRLWAYHKFHWDNAQVMVNAINEYRGLLHG